MNNHTISLRIEADKADIQDEVLAAIAAKINQPQNKITGFHILKKSIDARSKIIWINLTVAYFIEQTPSPRGLQNFIYKDVSNASKKVIIIGAGPAGLFAALQLIELGVQPIVLERGKDVRNRRRDLATMNKNGIVNTESNYCFGEGGAGTYSDGKLYTRSSKRGSIERILQLFYLFGADEKILYEAHPHIGTNKLPQIIVAMREKIIACGGQVLFNEKVVDFDIKNNQIKWVKCSSGNSFEADAVILATGHSARDIFYLLHDKKILIEAKPFALGVRIEHQQSLIDLIQYKHKNRPDYLPPASYGWVEQVNSRGVFSFCMCPGGIIAPAATGPNEIVVNGWSPSKRNNVYSNSGIVVQIHEQDAFHAGFGQHSLSLLAFQEMVEQKSFVMGGGELKAPAQRLVDFCENKISQSLPTCSYLPGITSVNLKNTLPSFVVNTLQQGFQQIGKKMKGYFTNDAVVVATESRTSSPIRIPRDKETLQHPQVNNLYPCGEGAGYAGGIMSAAMDGELVARKIFEQMDVDFKK